MRTPQTLSTIIRLPSVLNIMGISRATLYKQIQAGIFPPPINLGARSVGWVSDEVQTIVNARIMGITHDELIKLVTTIHHERQTRSL